MKLLLVGNYRGVRNYSMDAYFAHVQALASARGFKTTSVFPEQGDLAAKASKPMVKKWLGYFDQFVVFPKTLRQLAPSHDVAHIPDQGSAPFINWLDPSRTVVTIHDLLAIRAMLGELPYWSVGRTGRAYQSWILKSLRRGKWMPCVSTKTSEDAQRLLALTPAQSPVILNSCFQSLAGQAAESDPPYIHNVAHAQPYKNRIGALRIGERLLAKPGFESHRLKLAGGEPTPELAKAISDSPVRARIDVVVHPSGDELRALVLGSSLLLFPSWDEGFGLPILEAQTAGICPAASNRAPMTEVGGEACLYFDPSDADGAAASLAAAWPSRQEVISKGPANLARFTPEVEGEALAKLYRKASGGTS